MGVKHNRVRPKDIASNVVNRKLARKRTTDMKVRIYRDQRELMEEYCNENNISISRVMRKLVNFFLETTKTRRERIVRHY